MIAKREEDRRYRERHRQAIRDRHREEQRRYVAANRERINAARRKVAPVAGTSFAHRLLANELYAAANRLVSKHIPEHGREDVISELVLGVLAGDFTLDNMAQHVKDIVKQHGGMTGKYDILSLDAIVGPNQFTRGQAIGVY